MLSQRTNVLLSPLEYDALLALASKHEVTMGELIRRAVRKTYKIKVKNDFEASLARIRQLTRGVKTTKVELRKWVVEGRKYED